MRQLWVSARTPPRAGPIAGPMTTAMPKIELTMPVCRRGKLSSRMAFDSGTTGAPRPPWAIRHSTSASSESAEPHIQVAIENPMIDQVMTVRRPKRAVSHPVIGVTTAVARMLNVMVHEISSAVVASVPCICGSRVDAISRVIA